MIYSSALIVAVSDDRRCGKQCSRTGRWSVPYRADGPQWNECVGCPSGAGGVFIRHDCPIYQTGVVIGCPGRPRVVRDGSRVLPESQT